LKRLAGKGAGGRAPAPGYEQAFNTPGSLHDDEDDDDEEDIGKDISSAQNVLDYDSDEKDEETDAQHELISLVGNSSNKRKKVPKLKRPGK